jgi:regulator of replication initiation timing
MATITDITSWFQKNTGWIKTVAILLLIGFLILAVTNSGCVQRQRDEFIKQTTILHLLNDSLDARNKVLQDSIFDEYSDRILLGKNDSILKLKNDSLTKISRYLKLRIDSVHGSLKDRPADSIYKFLTNDAYPEKGPGMYLFNEPQIRQINEDYIKTGLKDNLISTLEKQIGNHNDELAIMDSLVFSFQKSNTLLKVQNDNLTKTISNKDQEIGLYQKQEKQSSTQKFIWKVSTAMATVIALIFAFK